MIQKRRGRPPKNSTWVENIGYIDSNGDVRVPKRKSEKKKKNDFKITCGSTPVVYELHLALVREREERIRTRRPILYAKIQQENIAYQRNRAHAQTKDELESIQTQGLKMKQTHRLQVDIADKEIQQEIEEEHRLREETRLKEEQKEQEEAVRQEKEAILKKEQEKIEALFRAPYNRCMQESESSKPPKHIYWLDQNDDFHEFDKDKLPYGKSKVKQASAQKLFWKKRNVHKRITGPKMNQKTGEMELESGESDIEEIVEWYQSRWP